LQFGEEGERYAISKLKGNGVRKMEGNFSAFDYIVVNGKDIELYEVKTDRLAKNTGNIAVEYQCIQATRADYWLFVIYPEVYKVPVSVLKKWIDGMFYSNIVQGGDFLNSILYLFPREILLPFKLADGPGDGE
jgi:hypothetical protein